VSLVVDLAVLAEGMATDSRGNITLVGANPNIFLLEALPFQMSPFLLVALKDDEGAKTLAPGRVIAATIRVTGPDGEVIFIAPAHRQTITPPPHPALLQRVNIVGQVPFTASKNGTYTVSAHITVVDGDSGASLAETTAERTVVVNDLASLKPKAN
jgi:hypothetical protein